MPFNRNPLNKKKSKESKNSKKITNMKLLRLKDREGIRSCKATLCSKEIDTDFATLFKNFS